MEVEKIEEKLRSKEWGVRVEGLRDFRKLLESESLAGCHDDRIEINELKRMGILELISKNMKDLRSLVAAEACRCAETCGERLVGSSEILCELWLQVVINLCGGSAPRVVTNAADAAARSIVEHCSDPSKYYGIISKLRSIAAKARAAPARSASLRLVALGLKRWPLLEKDHKLIEPMAKEAAQCFVDRARDADPEARSAAREIFFALSDHGFMEIAAKARERIDPATRKQLDRQRPPPSPNDDSIPKRLLKRNLQFQEAHNHTRHHHRGDMEHGQDLLLVQSSRGHTNQPLPPPPVVPNPAVPQFTALVKATEEEKDHHHHPPPDDNNTLVEQPVVVGSEHDFCSDDSVDDEEDGPPPPPGPPPSKPESAGKKQKGPKKNVNELCSQAMSSPHWDVRRDAVLGLGDATISGVPEAWRAVTTAALDGHHQVAASALDLAANALGLVSSESASRALGQSQSNYDTVLGTLLAAAVTRCADARPGVRGAALRALDAAKDAVAPSSLIAAASAASPDIRGNKAKAALFDFIASLCTLDAELEPELQAELLNKLSILLKATHPTSAKRPLDDALFSAGAHCLDQLRRLDPVGLADRAALLGPDHRRSLLVALQGTAPEFEGLLSQARRRALDTMTTEDVSTEEEHIRLDDEEKENRSPTTTALSPRTHKKFKDEPLESSLPQAVAALAAEASASFLSNHEDADIISSQARAARRFIFRSMKRYQNDPAWNRFFQQIAMLLLERACTLPKVVTQDVKPNAFTLRLSDIAARHEALGLLRIMSRQAPNRFLDVLDAAAPRLLQVASLNSLPLELAFAAERVLYNCVKRVDPKPIFFAAKNILLAAAPFQEDDLSSEHSDAHAYTDNDQQEQYDLELSYRASAPALRLLTVSIPQMPPPILRDHLHHILARLSQLLNAHHAPVRKAAVDTIVEFNLALGDLDQLPSLLRDDQIKLIAFYLQQKKKQV